MSEKLKFLIVGDLHGVKPKIHVNLKEIDAIICPGDICSDDIRDYVKKWIQLRTNYDENMEFNQVCSEEEEEKLEKISLEKGRLVLEYLNSLGKPVFLVPGNWDQTSYIDGGKNKDNNNWNKIKKGLKNIIDVEFSSIDFNGVTFIGHGSVSAPEPLIELDVSDFENEEEFEEYFIRYKFFKKIYLKMRKLFANAKKPIIHISHNVPYNSKLDVVNAPETYAHNKHYGSLMARELIDEFEPLICIGGHIHEGFGNEKIGNTLCVNAGFGGDVNTLIEIDVKLRKILTVKTYGNNAT